MKMIKCYLNLNIFTVFLKNRNFISKIRISKVTDYAALTSLSTDRIDLINIHQSLNKKTHLITKIENYKPDVKVALLCC